MTPPKPRAARRQKAQPSITDAQRVIECKLAPWGRGHRYQATMDDGSKRWLRRTNNLPELEESQEAALVPLHVTETTEAELEELFRLL